MPAGRLSSRWSRVAARLAALATALVAALVVALLAAACHGGPGAAPPPSAQSAPSTPRVQRARRAPTTPRNVLTAEQLRGVHVTRVEELIAGRVAGVYVQRTADGFSIRIRGVSTILGEPEPLVVLDGLPLTQGARELALISPADVARIEVLKDAGSTALYGMRGANGVLVITTRRPPR